MDNAAFQWNAGGWFGAQLGGTCWMLIAGILLVSRDAGVAVATLAVFATVNLIGTIVWTQRARLQPLPAIQGLVVLSGVGATLATYIMERIGRVREARAVRDPVSEVHRPAHPDSGEHQSGPERDHRDPDDLRRRALP